MGGRNIVVDGWRYSKRWDRPRRNFGRLPKMKMEAYLVFLWPNCRVDEPSHTDLSSFYATFLSLFLHFHKGLSPLSSLPFSLSLSLFSILPASSHLDLEASLAAPEIRRRFHSDCFFTNAASMIYSRRQWSILSTNEIARTIRQVWGCILTAQIFVISSGWKFGITFPAVSILDHLFIVLLIWSECWYEYDNE